MVGKVQPHGPGRMSGVVGYGGRTRAAPGGWLSLGVGAAESRVRRFVTKRRGSSGGGGTGGTGGGGQLKV